MNSFAVLGQVFYGYDHYAPTGWSPEARLAVAIGAAVGLESIALYVSWHAHDALLMGASATAARMRRAAYVIAFGVAAINYAHFSPDWRPTGAAIVFAGFSASSPWLWGLHTRRAHHIQLIREGQVDATGAVFSAERWRAFPLRTWRARRWSIDFGVNDPRQAWRAYNATRQTSDTPTVGVSATPQTPAGARPPDVPAGPTNEPAGDPPLRKVADLVAVRAAHQRVAPTSPLATANRTANATVGEPPTIAANANLEARARELVAAGAGRDKLVAELGLQPTKARQIVEEIRPPKPRQKRHQRAAK